MIGLLLKQTFDSSILPYIEKNKECCVFSTGAPTPNFKKPFLQTLRIYDFDKTVIATDITTAMLASTLILPKKKYFYITNLEWVGHNPLVYQELREIYLNEELELIASNESDYKTIKNLFKKPKFIVKNWDFSEIEK
jgi:hypothetical protein